MHSSHITRQSVCRHIMFASDSDPDSSIAKLSFKAPGWYTISDSKFEAWEELSLFRQPHTKFLRKIYCRWWLPGWVSNLVICSFHCHTSLSKSIMHSNCWMFSDALSAFVDWVLLVTKVYSQTHYSSQTHFLPVKNVQFLYLWNMPLQPSPLHQIKI